MESDFLLVLFTFFVLTVLLIENWVNPVTEEQKKQEAIRKAEILIAEKEKQLEFIKEQYNKLKGA